MQGEVHIWHISTPEELQQQRAPQKTRVLYSSPKRAHFAPPRRAFSGQKGARNPNAPGSVPYGLWTEISARTNDEIPYSKIILPLHEGNFNQYRPFEILARLTGQKFIFRQFKM